MRYSVFVRNVREEEEEATLEKFTEFGEVLDLHRPTGSRNVFIRYGSKEEADLAVSELQGVYELSHAREKRQTANFYSERQHDNVESAAWNENPRGGLSRDNFGRRETNKVENEREDVSSHTPRNKYQTAKYEKRSVYQFLPQDDRHKPTPEDDLEMAGFMKRLQLNRGVQRNGSSLEARGSESKFDDGPPPLVPAMPRNGSSLEARGNESKFDDGPPPLVPAMPHMEMTKDISGVEECLKDLPKVKISKNDGDEMPLHADELVVGNLSKITTGEDLLNLFERLDPEFVSGVKYTDNHVPYRLIQFSTVKAVTFALNHYTNIHLHGKHLTLKRLSTLMESNQCITFNIC